MKSVKWILLSALGIGSFMSEAQISERKLLKYEPQLRSDIEYLASDDLEGRLTGSEGELKSAEFIAARMKKLGLKPGGEQNSYFQKFEIITLRMTLDASRLELAGVNYPLFKEFFPVSMSSNEASINSEAVYVGFGIQSESPLRKDYEGRDVKGKVVLIDLGSPDGIHPHSAYLSWHGMEKRVEEARRQGAIGVIFFRKDAGVEKPDGQLSLKVQPSDIPVVFCDKDLSILPVPTPVRLEVKVLVTKETGHNVIGFKDNKARHTVVIGAHHDHLGRGQMGNSLSTEQGHIHNGADDNASGTAGLLWLGKQFSKKRRWNKKNNYLFIAFSGEELGLIGSKYFMEHPTMPIEQMNYMINMDMIGKLDSAKKAIVINGVGTSPAWKGALAEVSPDTNRLREIVTTDGGIGASDHTSFYLKRVPAIHYFTGQHVHYHKPSDDKEILNYGGELFVLNHIVGLVAELNHSGKLEFTETKSSDSTGRMKFNVTLGIMPDYLYSGEGVKVDGVKDGMPGMKSGIEKGDIIVSLNGVFITDMKTYMKVLSELKKGQMVPATIKRNQEEVKLNIQF